MNPILETWLKEQEAKKQSEETTQDSDLEIRKQHLISLGLCTTSCTYFNHLEQPITKEEYEEGLKNGEECYMVEEQIPIDVTDEEYEQICQHAPDPTTVEELLEDKKADKHTASIKSMTTGAKICFILVILWIIDLILKLFLYGIPGFIEEGGDRSITCIIFLSLVGVLIEVFFKKKQDKK